MVLPKTLTSLKNSEFPPEQFPAPYCAAATIFLSFGLLEIRLSSRGLFLRLSSFPGRRPRQLIFWGWFPPPPPNKICSGPLVFMKRTLGPSYLFSWGLAFLILLFSERGRGRNKKMMYRSISTSNPRLGIRPTEKSRFKNRERGDLPLKK